jgi:acyl carrier protein
MSNLEELKWGVIEIVADIAELEIDEVSPEATLEDLGVDSLGGLRIVAAVEKKYKLVIDEQEIMKIRTMPDVFSLVERHLPDVE